MSSIAMHSEAAMFGSSYAACFYIACMSHRFKLDFYCGQHSSIYSNLAVDPEVGQFQIRKNAGEWAQTVFAESTSTNRFNRPSDYKYFVINTFLPLDVPSLCCTPMSIAGLSRTPTLSMSLIRSILAAALERDDQLMQSVAKHKAFIRRLHDWNSNASIFVVPQPFEIQPDYLEPTADSPSSGESALVLASFLDKVSAVFAELTGLKLIMPPATLMVDGGYTARQYCTLTKDRNWRGAVDQNAHGNGDEQADQSVKGGLKAGLSPKYLPPTNRHRNVDYAIHYLDRLQDLFAASS
jgi:hypothetical protein